MVQENVPKEIKDEYQKGNRILKKGDKYFCSECHSEIPLKKSCPICKKELDWDRIQVEIRR